MVLDVCSRSVFKSGSHGHILHKENTKGRPRKDGEGVGLRSKQLMFTCQDDWGAVQLPKGLSPSPNLETSASS